MFLSLPFIHPQIVQEGWRSPEATIFIAWYSFGIHFLFGFHCLDIYRGNESDFIFSPLFELTGDNLKTISLSLACYSFLFMFLGSLGLIKGVKRETRILYFPYLYMAAIELVYLVYHVYMLFSRYSFDLNTLVGSTVILMFIVLHSFQYWVVYRNYKDLKRLQNPTLIFTALP